MTAAAGQLHRRARTVGLLVVALCLVVGSAPGRAQDAPSLLDDRPVVTTSPAEAWAPMPPGATARAFVVVDAETGQELAARQAGERLPVASTVKLLTVLTALDTVGLDEVVTVGQEVTVGEAGVGLAPGDRWTVRQLLEGIIVRSGNDAALALAAHAGGDVETFVEAMRARAAALGLEGAVVEDPTGLDDTNRLSARDLAAIARAALAIPVVAEVADLETVDLPGLGVVGTRNLLLERRPEVTGLKTGYTDAAGWCLVASMTTDDGREVLAVVLGARDDEARFDESLALLDFADDDLQPRVVEGGARFRVPGEWLDHTQDVELSVPVVGDVRLVARVEEGRVHQEVVHDGDVVAAVDVGVPGAATPGTTGARLAGRMYEVMRAAHGSGAWSAVTP